MVYDDASRYVRNDEVTSLNYCWVILLSLIICEMFLLTYLLIQNCYFLLCVAVISSAFALLTIYLQKVTRLRAST